MGEEKKKAGKKKSGRKTQDISGAKIKSNMPAVDIVKPNGETVTIPRIPGTYPPTRNKLMQVQTDPAVTETMLDLALTLLENPPVQLKDVEAVEERTLFYFRTCIEKGIAPSVAGYAVSLGVDRKTIWAHIHDGRPAAQVLSRAVTVIEANLNNDGMKGNVNPIMAIFLLKNMGYSDRVETVVTPGTPLGQLSTVEEIKQKYSDLPDD